MKTRTLVTIDRLLRGFLVVSFVLIALIVNQTPTVTGYEPSLFDGFPSVFWWLLYATMAASGAGIAMSVLLGLGRVRTSIVFLSASILMIIFLALPEAHGYALFGRGSADVLQHLGYTKTILKTNHVGETNWYPMLHLLAATFVKFGIPLHSTPLLISLIFSISYPYFIYVFVRHITGKKRYAPLAFVVTLPFLYANFHRTSQPAILSFLMFPLLIYILERDRFDQNWRWFTILVVLLVGIVFFHPTSTVLLEVIIITLTTSTIIINRFTDSPYQNYRWRSNLIAAISFTIWSLQFTKTQFFIMKAIFIVLGKDISSVGGTATSHAATFNTLWALLVRLVELYGPILLYFGIASLGVILIAARKLNMSSSFYSRHFSIQYIVAGVFSSVLLFVPLFGSNIYRTVRYAILISNLLVATIIIDFVRIGSQSLNSRIPIDGHTVVTLLLLIILLIAAPLSMVNVYRDTDQLARTELKGTDWFVNHFDDSHNTRSLHMTYKMRSYLVGADKVSKSTGPFVRIGVERTSIPPGIGYDSNKTIERTFDGEPTYVITKTYDIKEFKTDSNVVPIYNRTDLKQMKSDTTVKNIYSNGGYTVWFTS